MQDELWLRRGARGEIEQQRVVGAGFAVGDKRRGRAMSRLPPGPARHRSADGNPAPRAGETGEFVGLAGAGDDVADATAGKAVDEIVAAQAASSPG